MGTRINATARAIWNGPFHMGALSRPVSVGDVLLKLLETMWRAIVALITLLVVGGLVIAAWVLVVEPTFFPPLQSKIVASASYDDGISPLPPVIRTVTDVPRKGAPPPFRCTKEYPVKVLFTNTSGKLVSQLSFSIRGMPPGRSGDVIEDGTWRQADVLIRPGFTWSSCWSFAVRDGYTAETLTYVVEVVSASEADPSIRDQPIRPLPPVPTPTAKLLSPQPIASATPVPPISLSDLKDDDWQKIGMGCSCSFTAGASSREKLIAGGDGRAFFRIDGEDHLCAAPETQSLFDGPVSFSCGSASVKITPYGRTEPGEDGHSSKALLQISIPSAELRASGTWGCAC